MKTLRPLVLVLALVPLIGCATAYDALRVLVDAAFPPPHDDVEAIPPSLEPFFPCAGIDPAFSELCAPVACVLKGVGDG